MIALQITDLKDFMNRLLKSDLFDPFWVVEVSITTYNTFLIDGSLHRDFLDSSALEILDKTKRTHSLWREVKPFCLSIIRGKHTPLHFKIVFMLSKKNTEKLLLGNRVPLSIDDIFGLFVNFQYDGTHLTCTTGTSVKTFTLDKTLDHVWDELVQKFFRQQQIPYEIL